jgi:2',3'-cyclic-nucleotide 2'-phosphodiesterase (5'-nucleotidase family)
MGRARLIIDAFNRLEIEAYTPGERDLTLGLENLKALAATAKLPFLAANLTDKDGKKPFQSTLVRAVGKLKVGVIGLVGQRLTLTPEALVAAGVAVSDPVAATKAEVAALAPEAVDLLLVLGHLDPGEEDALAAAVPEVRFVVGGHAARMLPQPRALAVPAGGVASAWALDAGSKGKYLGKLGIYLPLRRDGPLRFADLNNRMELRGQTIALDKDIERTRDNILKARTDPANSEEQRQKRIKGLEAAVERNEKTLKERRAALASLRPPQDGEALLRNELLPVATTLEPEPEIDKAVTAFIDSTKPSTPPAPVVKPQPGQAPRVPAKPPRGKVFAPPVAPKK